MKKIRITTIIILCCIFLTTAASLIFSGLQTVLADTLEYCQLSLTTLETETQRGDKPNKSPQITVFTYGCGGNLAHWSNNQGDENVGNNYQFAYEENSLINQYVEKIGADNCLLYVAQLEDKLMEDRNSEIGAVIPTNNTYFQGSYKSGKANQKVKLFNLFDDENNNYNLEESINLEELSVLDIANKHLILLFNIINKDDVDLKGDKGYYHSNDYVYAQFEYVLDAISYQYCQIMGELPIYNLVGHSRGGITNLQYAMGHPNNVASLFSMGTPYNGSNFGSATNMNGDHFFIQLAGMDVESAGVQDILNSNLSNAYRQIWNEGISEDGTKIYDHIKFVPIGSYVTLGFVCQLLADYLTGIHSLSKFEEVVLRTLAVGLEVGITGLSLSTANNWAIPSSLGTTKRTVKTIISKCITDENSKNGWLGIIDSISGRSQILRYEHIEFFIPSVLYIEDDLFIDLNSQVADGYNGAQPLVKAMNTIDQIEGGKSEKDAGVGHNLETHDKHIIERIIKEIDLTGRATVASDNNQGTTSNAINENTFGETTIGFTTVRNGVVIKYVSSNSGVASIPDTLDGKTVIAVDSVAFEEYANTYGIRRVSTTPITSITLPSTVQRINAFAFKGMTSLSSINLGGVTEIGYGAFAGCTSLSSVTIPASTTKIDDYAFYNSAISSLSFESGSMLTEIGHFAFAGCSLSGSLTIPSSVTTIGIGAFMNATELTSVSYTPNNTDLTITTSIGDFAFYGCSNLYFTAIPNVNNIGSFAFANCKWGNSNESITLTIPSSVQNIGMGAFYGCSQIVSFNVESTDNNFHVFDGVLYVKQSNDESVEYYLHTYPMAKTGSEYTPIASLVGVFDYAFSGNTNLTTVNLSNVQFIGSNVFEGCTGLAIITVDTNNLNYSTSSGVLLNKQATCLIYYPMGKTSSSYTVPISVTEIDSGAFSGNTHLTSVNLRNTKTIGDNAFFGCTNLATITANVVTEAISSAFEGTAWYATQSQADLFSIGKTLLKCNDNESVILDLTAYEVIAEYAFTSIDAIGNYTVNNKLKTVYLGANYSLFNFESFYNCVDLSNVYLLNDEVVQIGNLPAEFNEQITFYVPISLYESYTTSYENLNFEVIKTTVEFYVDETLFGTETAYYGEVFSTDYALTVTGNNVFLGWYEIDYTRTFIGSVYDGYETYAYLYAKILPTYTLKFVYNGAVACSDITGVYDGLTIELPAVTGVSQYCWTNNGNKYKFNSSLDFLHNSFVVDENGSYVITFNAVGCNHTSKTCGFYSVYKHCFMCDTCEYTELSVHLWTALSNGKYRCKICNHVTAIIPMPILNVEDDELIQSLGVAQEGEIVTASNGLNYIYLDGEFYLIVSQDDLICLSQTSEDK